ncbi:MAG TPA: NUDIX hydrolase [Ktedonobacterales bacterium]|jgi:ADP-ribose pyrophosphatase YjhB (NUDIX family)
MAYQGDDDTMANDRQQESKARFRVAAFAIIEQEGKYLLARRRDIGWWNLAGGGLENGETVDEGLAREIMEEIHLAVTIERVVGIYSKPRKNEVVITFLCHPAPHAGKPRMSDEVSEVGWFAPDRLPDRFLPKHRQRLEDALLGQREAIVRAQRTSTEEDQGLPPSK